MSSSQSYQYSYLHKDTSMHQNVTRTTRIVQILYFQKSRQVLVYHRSVLQGELKLGYWLRVYVCL